MQTSFIGALTPDMVAAGKGSGTTAQTLYAMSKSWDVRSSTQPETVDEEAAMQQLLTEAGSFKCFTATQAKMMLDLIRHGNKTASLVRAH